MCNTSTKFDVLVLGDVDVEQRLDVLSEAAAQAGAVIAQTFMFPTGEAAQHDDLTEVDAVVEALGHAIATRTSIWMPWWHQDLCREQHLRRLGLTLQRHGLDLRIGQHLEPCPIDGGINELDSAVRNEVRAVYALDDAAMAAAGMHTLGPEIEAALSKAARYTEALEPQEHLYSTAEVAALLGRSTSWVSRGLRDRVFAYGDGSPVEPLITGERGVRRFTTAMLRAIVWSAFRRGSLTPTKLEEVLETLSLTQR